MTARDRAIAAAGAVLADALAERDERTPRQAAEAAWRPGSPPVDELEARIAAQRAQSHPLAS